MTHPPTPPPGYQYQYGHGPYDHLYGPGVQPQPGYGPWGAPQAARTGDDTTWAVMSYIGMLLVGFLAPLVIYFAQRNQSALARFHAAQALNYTITSLIQMLAPLAVAIPLALIAGQAAWLILIVPVLLFHMVAQWVLLIMGAIKAGRGEYWRMPAWLCFPLIR
ncbi:DUF4870 domain-containing protein [Thermomonospora catenispora]|uniref:DUF4870 domain-containing protein n=1 Tax=Thermomonospora catenispora TaxID=2493090 RepID=UPI00111CA472|nr:DUF4870 domain-containing protein [Thermomonospora catenispora]TNY36035.1 DUF4870 domain-containing protein [Thermomonospora catenispora]